ncbi:unnamed protein product [Tenebrio molitor]|nr:unnamed protein product [Tenebrio molitor]
MLYFCGQTLFELDNDIVYPYRHSYRIVSPHVHSVVNRSPRDNFSIMLCKVLALLLFAACVCAYEDCGSKDGSIVSVTVSNCSNDKKCILKRNTNASIEIGFTTNDDSDVLTSVVHGVILGVPFPFDIPNPDGCKDSGVSCPISAGQTYNYKASLPVLATYPRVTVDVKWELKDKDGNDVVCVLIPSQIK